MANRFVTRPIAGPRAFRSTGAAAVKSQAAILLLLGTQLRGDNAALQARARATGRRQGDRLRQSVMGLPGTARLFAANVLWRATSLDAAGQALVRALGSPDEDVRTIAGMFLVKAGKLASPLLREPLRQRENLPLILTIIGDIGDSAFEPELRRFSEDSDPEVARAARDALALHEAQPSPSVRRGE